MQHYIEVRFVSETKGHYHKTLVHFSVDLLGHEDNDTNLPQDLRRCSEVHSCQALDQEQCMHF